MDSQSKEFLINNDAESNYLNPLVWSRNQTVQSSEKKKLILLDRDNTVIVDAGQSNQIDELDFLPTALEALSFLNQHDFEIGLVTNQAGLTRGKYSIEQLDLFHSKMHDRIYDETGCKLKFVAICPHVNEQNCLCRKPKSGLLTAVHQHFQQMPLVFFGDADSDIKAAKDFGIEGILVKPGFLFVEVREWTLNR